MNKRRNIDSNVIIDINTSNNKWILEIQIMKERMREKALLLFFSE